MFLHRRRADPGPAQPAAAAMTRRRIAPESAADAHDRDPPSAWRSSAPATGGAASTPACSPTRPDTDAVRRGRPRRRSAPQQRAAEFGVPGYIDLDEMLERERPDLVSVCLPNEGALRADAAHHPGRRPAAGREAARVRPGRGRHAARRGGRARPVLRDQLQPPLRPAGAAGRRGDRARRRSGDSTFATWRFGGEAGHQQRIRTPT